MRKGYRIHGDCLDSISAEDCMNDEDFVWNFDIDREDLKEYLDSLLEYLNEDERRIIYLKFYEGLTFRQIKEEFSVSHQMIHKKFHRAIKKLRKIVKKLDAYNKLNFEDEEVDEKTIIKGVE
jgi:RNA polymerase sigma factor (sigma-70 family)